MSHCDDISPNDAAFVRAMLQDEELAVDVPAGYRRVLVRARRRTLNTRRIAYGLAAAAAIAVALLLLPVGSYARQFLAIFEPREFVPIYLSSGDRKRMRNPAIGNLGRLRFVRTMSRVTMPSSQAVADAGFQPRLPPAGALAATARYYFLPAGRVDFSFDRSRAAAYESRSGRRLPPMPAELNDASIRITSGPGIVAEFKRANGQMFTIVELHAPIVSSTGASMAEIEKYLASLPEVPGDVSDQLKSLASPSTMFPVPLNARSNSVSTIYVDGAKALAVGDETGLGSGILWQSQGIIYSISGTIDISEATKLANALE
jgi:hypothetical protein